MTIYKVLGEDGKPFHGGTGTWPLPKNSKPGAWLTVNGALVPCVNGIHLCEEKHLIGWIGPTIWEAEYKGKKINHSDKLVVRSARLLRRIDTWNDRTARLFACDCAERALHLFEKQFPDDPRARTAIETARLYANGKATLDDLDAAGGAARAAWAACAASAACAVSAASAASAACAVSAASAAWDAWDACAAWDAWDACAASAAEREWQTQRLVEYLHGDHG